MVKVEERWGEEVVGCYVDGRRDGDGVGGEGRGASEEGGESRHGSGVQATREGRKM